MIISESLIKSWFTLQSQLISGLQIAYVELHGSGVPPSGLTVSYPEDLDSTTELSLAAQLARRSGAPVTGSVASKDGEAAILRIAYPMQLGQHAQGALVVEVKAALDQQATILQLLKWGESWLNLVIEQRDDEPDSQGYKRLIQAGMAQQGYHDTLTVVLALLRIRTGCTRVALGRSTESGVELESVSELGELDSRSARTKSIESAMTRALQSGGTVSRSDSAIKSNDQDPLSRLLVVGSLSGVCCVPLLQGMRTPLVLCFEYGNGFGDESNRRSACEEGATIVAPLLELQRQSKQPLLRRFAALCQEGIQQLLDVNGRQKRIALGVLGLLFAVFALSPGEYRVPASATLQGAVQRAVVAPFDSYILEANVRAGHKVKKGDLLARLDDRELTGERRRLRGEQGELTEQHRQAVVTLDHGKAKILEAQLEQARAKLSLIQDQLSRTELRAPLGGLVISGDWSRSLGVPIQRGDLLFQISPLDKYQVVMEVSDRDIADLKVAQQGALTLSALPRQTVNFSVTGISRMAPEVAAEPTFRVEAALSQSLQGMRPGMQGIAKIEVGQHRRWWIWTHELTDWVRLKLWRMWP